MRSGDEQKHLGNDLGENYEFGVADSFESINAAVSKLKKDNLDKLINAVILYPDPDYSSSSSSGSRRYRACIYQNGDWVRNKNQNIISITMDEMNVNTVNKTDLVKGVIEEVDKRRPYLLYFAENTEESKANAVRALKSKSNHFNAVMICFDENSNTYLVYILQSGTWVRDQNQQIKEVSIVIEEPLQRKGLREKPNLADLQLMHQAFVRVGIVEPGIIHRMMAIWGQEGHISFPTS